MGKRRRQLLANQSCGAEKFWQQQGESGRAERNLFGEPIRPLP
jgi:hypothetical protein